MRENENRERNAVVNDTIAFFMGKMGDEETLKYFRRVDIVIEVIF